MPCCLFTYHAYGSWMPDHRRGYVHRHDGIQPPDEHMAGLYRANLKQVVVRFNRAIQQQVIDGTLEACASQQLRCHFIATEPTHVHVLVSWTTDRGWQVVRAKLRESLSRRLNSEFERRQWFSKGGSRRLVKDQAQFDYLVSIYLPKHSGLKWCEGRGVFQ